jgi:hypothetical protein
MKRCRSMPKDSPLTRGAFLHLAKEAGLDVDSPHMDELYPYVREVLAGFEPLKGLDVADAEPPLAFIPPQE